MENKFKQIIEILNTMNEIYTPNIERSKLFYETYYQDLKDLPVEQIAKNAQKHRKTSQFFPKPVDLRNDGDESDQGLLAWFKVSQAIKKHGYWDSVKFDDPIIHSTIEFMGGWIKLSGMLEDEEKWKQKEFCQIYKIMQKRTEHPEYLTGQHEINNGMEGLPIPSMILIDEDEKGLINYEEEQCNKQIK